MQGDYLTKLMRRLQKTVRTTAPLTGLIRWPAVGGDVDHGSDKTNYPFVFVHGFFGWGRYDKGSDKLTYWGMFSGDLIEKINRSGFTAVSASVDTVGSAWDRACELYAQLTGTRVDYGKAHSERFGHPRYGEDYTGRALLPRWDGEHKINLIGHSFGGPTSTLFASILAYGSTAEIAATTDGTLSDFFKGGKPDWIYSITGLSAAFNGTTLAMNHQALEEIGDYLNAQVDRKYAKLPDAVRALPKKLSRFWFGKMANVASGEVAAPDTGLWDMDPDQSVLLNQSIRTVPDVYYFSVPHDATKDSDDGTHRVPDRRFCDSFFVPLVYVLGHTNTVTKGGMVLDKRWQPNDGLVNTISETAPFDKESDTVGAPPSPALAKKGFSRGVYHVFPTLSGAHMVLLGNVFTRTSAGMAYLYGLMSMINAL
ncbi:MAG: hypothetical protein II804_08580 [Clostridia bacterium]|nr:hypothetical protein [Clostridia bacterium]